MCREMEGGARNTAGEKREEVDEAVVFEIACSKACFTPFFRSLSSSSRFFLKREELNSLSRANLCHSSPFARAPARDPLARRPAESLKRAEESEKERSKRERKSRLKNKKQMPQQQQSNVAVAMLGGGPITRAAAHAAASTSCGGGGAPSTSAPTTDSTGYGGGKRRSGSGGGGEVS